ncbi:hypothetical protein [Pararhizobium sp. PWRC1-1]|uniref:hypothetical protein n=1 Tax=Pararhizobium sp. PWRC1-1 TaxID=2804566 RepID=UPI003CF6CB11
MTVDRAATETFMPVAGEGILVPVETFLQAINDHGVRDYFLRYVHTCGTQAVYSAQRSVPDARAIRHAGY